MILRNQVIAQSAYSSVVAIKGAENEKNEREELLKNYATIAHKLPTMILQNGLAQATGFLLAKSAKEESAKEKAHAEMLKHLLAALQKIDDDFKHVQKNEEFHQKIIDSNLTQIMRYTRESLEIAGWLRRYVQGILKRGATGDTEGAEIAKEGEQ